MKNVAEGFKRGSGGGGARAAREWASMYAWVEDGDE